MSSELTLEEAALAWAQKKNVEASPLQSDRWLLVDPVGKKLAGHYPASVFCNADWRFRLAPEPPAKKWRPYTREQLELLIGKTVKVKSSKTCWLIIGVIDEAVHIGNLHFTFNDLFELCTWADGSPCGVEVSE